MREPWKKDGGGGRCVGGSWWVRVGEVDANGARDASCVGVSGYDVARL